MMVVTQLCLFLEQMGTSHQKGEFGAGGCIILYLCFGGDYMAVTHRRTIHKKMVDFAECKLCFS